MYLHPDAHFEFLSKNLFIKQNQNKKLYNLSLTFEDVKAVAWALASC